LCVLLLHGGASFSLPGLPGGFGHPRRYTACPLFPHLLVISPATGATRYYEFGRYNSQQCGIVRRRSVPDLTIGSDGLPTQESLQGLYTFLSKHYGQESNVSATSYAASDHQATIDYAERFIRDPHRPCYNLLTNNCKTFARDAATACEEGQICQ